MRRPLLDVNVLVALFDPAHLNHDQAHGWFSQQRRYGWATSPSTINGCVRVLSNPAYPTVQAKPADVISRLTVFRSSPNHEFWADSVDLLDTSLINPRRIAGHQKITDVCLLALAFRHDGRLATFDRSIPVTAVIGAKPEHLEVIGDGQ